LGGRGGGGRKSEEAEILDYYYTGDEDEDEARGTRDGDGKEGVEGEEDVKAFIEHLFHRSSNTTTSMSTLKEVSSGLEEGGADNNGDGEERGRDEKEVDERDNFLSKFRMEYLRETAGMLNGGVFSGVDPDSDSQAHEDGENGRGVFERMLRKLGAKGKVSAGDGDDENENEDEETLEGDEGSDGEVFIGVLRDCEGGIVASLIFV
jgi:hypothetical protein